MRSLLLQATESVGDPLLAHLRSKPEQVAFMLGSRTAEPDTFRLRELLTLAQAELDYRWSHVTMSDESRRKLFAWAARPADILVEAHSHGFLGDPAAFSLTDLEGLSEWVPHMRWRLQGRPYGALVFGEESIDGIGWVDEATILPVSSLELVGGVVLRATGRSYQYLARDRHDPD